MTHAITGISRKRFVLIAAVMFAYGLRGETLTAQIDVSALRDRYIQLETTYEELRDQGEVDLTDAAALVPALEDARSQENWTTLQQLLDNFEAELLSAVQSQVEEPPLEPEPVAASGTFNRRSECHVLRELVKVPLCAQLLARRGAVAQIREDGAIGRNIPNFSDVSSQREAVWIVRNAVATGDSKALIRCVVAFEYGFQRQTPEGYFVNALGVPPETAMNCDAFFCEAFAHSYMLMWQFDADSDAVQRMQPLLARFRKAMLWLNANKLILKNHDRLGANRLLFDASAFLLAGRILNDKTLTQTGQEFLNDAISTQRADGVLLEHEGSDSSYQATSMLNLETLWFHDRSDTRNQSEYNALARAAAWEKTRILPDGRVDVTGNTRTGLGQEEFLGKLKDVNYTEVAMSLYYWSIVGEDPNSTQLADLVVGILTASSNFRRMPTLSLRGRSRPTPIGHRLDYFQDQHPVDVVRVLNIHRQLAAN